MIKGLPEKLKTLRKSLGYSQNSLAKRLHLSPAIISAYERGDRTPSIEILLSLSYIFHCSTDYLLGKDNRSTELNLSDHQLFSLMNFINSMRMQ